MLPAPSHKNVDESKPRNVDVALRGALDLGTKNSTIRMPWEQSPFTSLVMGAFVLPWLDVPEIPRVLPPLQSNLDETSACDDLPAKRQRIRYHMHVSRVGNQLLGNDAADSQSALGFQIVSDALRGKSTSTLKIRVSSLMLYVKWLLSSYPGEEFLPFSEERYYEYL